MVTLETLPWGLTFTAGVAVNETGVYWSDAVLTPATNGNTPTSTRVRVAPPGGGEAQTVAWLEHATPGGGFISCPGGICWAMADATAPAATGGSILRAVCP